MWLLFVLIFRLFFSHFRGIVIGLKSLTDISL
jgi:hypothetical protein